MRNKFAIYLYGVDRKPIPADFESIAENLQKVERLYFEMDGSFIWTGEDGEFRWQLDGMLYDAAGVIQYVDIQGWCPLREWLSLLNTIADQADWDQRWTVVRLPQLTTQSLGEFNQEIWCGGNLVR